LPSLSRTQQGIDWLRQFKHGDQADAAALLDQIKLVSRDALATQLQSLATARAQLVAGPVALYAEREVRKWKGEPHRLFKEKRGKVKRAFGPGPRQVDPRRQRDGVGSECLFRGGVPPPSPK
jgi:hypothetical protein